MDELFEAARRIATHPLTSGLSFVLGLYLGNRLAVDRDKRKEFNELAAPIAQKLRHQAETGHPANHIDATNCVERYMELHSRFGFKRAMRRYVEVQKADSKYNPETSSVTITSDYTDDERKAAAKAMLRYFRLR